MKPFVFSVMLLVALAGAAHAQVFRTVDPNRAVDVNDKTVEMPTVHFDTVPQPTRSQPVSPLSNQMREHTGTVRTKSVDTLKTLSYSTVPTTTLPRQNFTPKRAVADVPGNLPPAARVSSPKAELPKLVIRPFTPTGAEELKKQLDTPH